MSNLPDRNVVLIAGVHGVSGRAAAEHWAALPGTRVYGLSRRSAPLPAGVEAIRADLLDRGDLQRKLGTLSGITHLVFGAYIERPTAAERSQANLAILKNLLDAVEPASPGLRHNRFRRGPSDAILRLMDYDDVSSTIKARRAGFHDCIDTEDMCKNFFAKLRKGRVFP